MATKDTDKEKEEGKKPDRKMLIIAGVLVTVMLCVMGVLVVVLLKVSNPPPTQQTFVVDAKGVSTPVDEKTLESAKEKKNDETVVKAEKESKKSKDERPSYYKFTPAFIVNIPSNGRLRFLQVEVQLMARNDEDIKTIESYAPVIRNDLITLFSSQNYDDLLTPDGKENLRKSSLTLSRKILKDSTGKPCVEQVLFTNFVTQ
ncbi:MAG: flagellar basal body-associated FliL family protein [Candidatus Berkiella sp.]